MALGRATTVCLFALAPISAAFGAIVGARLATDGDRTETEPPGLEIGELPERMPSLAPLVDRVRGGVVGIRTVHRIDEPVEADGGQWEPDVSRGTGFLIHEEGLVLTARHLVADPTWIAVELHDGPRCEAHLVGEDPSTDLAVLRLVDPPSGLRPVRFGPSAEVRQGDWVVSIGNPLSFRQSVGVGVVAYVGRHLVQDGMGVTNDYLQVSMPMHPGSSGSPIFDLSGEVIGVTTRAATTAEDLSFAVSARMVQRVLSSIVANNGRARRAFLGVRLAPLDPATRSRIGLDASKGVLVTAVETGRPADVAGLRAGDVIVAFEGRAVENVHELHDWITWSKPDLEVELHVLRSDQEIETVLVRPAELPT